MQWMTPPSTIVMRWWLTIALSLALPAAASAQDALRGPLKGSSPVDVSIGLYFVDMVDINEDEGTFEFEAILTTRWHDPRLAFDPADAGVDERVYQGEYQFAEVFPGWWPQLVLRNESGRYERQGVVVRVQPSGDVSIVEQVQALAEARLNLRRIPFDRQRFEMTYEVLGFGADRVRLRADEARSGVSDTTLSQWRVGRIEARESLQDPAYLGTPDQQVSSVTFTLPATRIPNFLLRLIVLPIVMLVALSWAVFWMDRESVGERMDLSFIGILTVVAFQIVVAERLPRISYLTILSAFMMISYATLAATVVINLRVSFLDRQGKTTRGDRLDRTCRWLFPAAYFGSLAAVVGYFIVTG
jgi:Neurotransmitter-gated ion-channel ligand binding domain/Neurotransmitter-gated ion-channel transmembrane region